MLRLFPSPVEAGFLSAFLMVLTQTAGFADEKIRDVSPDGKFAMRISWDEKETEQFAAQLKDQGEKPLPDGMFSQFIKSIDLVSMPSKEKIVELFKPEDLMNFGDLTLIWSPDSRWCAFYFAEPATGDTDLYQQQDGKFVKVNSSAQDMRAKFKGDFRKEWIRPIKWVKPDTLLLEDEAFGNGGHWKFEVTVKIDANGQVHVSQKKLSAKAGTN